jgi:predicted RecB family nuclease
MTKEQTIKELTIIPGVGKSLATDLWNIGITSIADLKGQNPNKLYDLSNSYAGRFKTDVFCMFLNVLFITQTHRQINTKRKN